MAGYYFDVGSKFMINDNEYMVRREFELDYEVENLNYKKIELIRKNELLNLWWKGTLMFRINNEEENLMKIHNLNDLDDKSKKEAIERFKILEPVINGEILPSEIKTYLNSLGDRVKLSTFYEWKKNWDKTEDLRSLVSKKTGPKGARTQGKVLEILDEAIEYYLSSDGKFTLEDMYSEFTLRIDQENINREAHEKLEYVSRSKLRRRKMELIDIYKQDKEKYGTVLAKLKRDGTKEEVLATRPLQRVEIDWTTVDVMLIDPSNLKPKRPNLIYAVDKYSGIPLGFFVTFKPVDSNALKQCLIHLIMPKNYLKGLYPRIENEWVAHGIPHSIVVDNASVNDSYEFEEACYQVGIREVQFCKIDAGYQKATIERAFRKLNTLFIHNLKGTTFSNFIEKGRYDSEKKACITMQGFIYMAHIAMVDMVAHNYESRRGNSPHNIWIQGIEANKRLKLQLPRSIESLKIMLVAGSELRKIQQQGVVVENEHYYSRELMDLKNELEKYHREDERVRVRFDLSDMRKVYVYDLFNKKYIVAEQTGFNRKKIDTNFPVPYEVLELDSKVKVEIKKSFNPSNRAISKRKIKLIQQEDEKIIRKWNRGKQPNKTTSSSFLTEAVLKSETEIEMPLNNDEITILENKTSTQKAKNKEKELRKDKQEAKFTYMEIDDTDIDEIPTWGITIKKQA
ncbi:transposase family protein [Fredinandcohnia quinoae]|uniref:Transposase family protein n=1 Tax=Fredinandcohnia quinoae TaxID=2918902 RepID=A0AAW5EBR4_9BACI|nr:transposase family protein [Fredinandcohnia sp. SECRCQ15]MCH1627417.1 transposase family protein [Fredinandcohnia sp. SECRCQ15]